MSSPYSVEKLTDILMLALTALESGRYDHVYRRSQESGEEEPWHLGRDIDRLNACCPDFTIFDEDQYWDIVEECLKEAINAPLEAYKKPKEPISSHQEAPGNEMYAFIAQLEDFTRPIYTKFCLKELNDGTWYISIDCHT